MQCRSVRPFWFFFLLVWMAKRWAGLSTLRPRHSNFFFVCVASLALLSAGVKGVGTNIVNEWRAARASSLTSSLGLALKKNRLNGGQAILTVWCDYHVDGDDLNGLNWKGWNPFGLNPLCIMTMGPVLVFSLLAVEGAFVMRKTRKFECWKRGGACGNMNLSSVPPTCFSGTC